MLALARLLFRERVRRLRLHYGWICYATVGLMLAVFASLGATAIAGYVRQSSPAQLESFLAALWMGWIITAIFLGKDLSWQIRLERLAIYPVSGFARLYAMIFLIGFCSFPILLVLSAIAFWAVDKAGMTPAVLLSSLAAGLLYISSIRLIGSLARVLIYRGVCVRGPIKAPVAAALIVLAAWSGAALLHPGVGVILPAHQLGLVLSGKHLWRSLLAMAGFTATFIALDYKLLRILTYSGISGPLAPGAPTAAGRNLLRGSWPTPIFRISLLALVRTRNVVLLLMWGVSYGFGFMYMSRPDDGFAFFSMIWVVQLFHAYLRGNLLGIDRGSAWIYYMLPMPIEKILSSKSLSLSFIQGCMVAAVLAGGFLTAGPHITWPDRMHFLSYAVSGVLAGEAGGLYFTVRYPDPIDRMSQFSGGTSPGAMIVPIIHILFSVVFALATGLARHFTPAVSCGILAAAPLFLLLVRTALLRTWVRETMLNERETILKKLGAFAS